MFVLFKAFWCFVLVFLFQILIVLISTMPIFHFILYIKISVTSSTATYLNTYIEMGHGDQIISSHRALWTCLMELFQLLKYTISHHSRVSKWPKKPPPINQIVMRANMLMSLKPSKVKQCSWAWVDVWFHQLLLLCVSPPYIYSHCLNDRCSCKGIFVSTHSFISPPITKIAQGIRCHACFIIILFHTRANKYKL